MTLTSPQDLLIITASNGENLRLANRIAESANKLKISSELIDLTKIDLPLFNPRFNSQVDVCSKVKALNESMSTTPRWIICAPEYNGSIPPILSNAIAWLSIQEDDFRYLFNGRPIAIASHSGGGCMELLISMRVQLSHLGAQVLGRQLASNNSRIAKDDSIAEILILLMQMTKLSN